MTKPPPWRAWEGRFRSAWTNRAAVERRPFLTADIAEGITAVRGAVKRINIHRMLEIKHKYREIYSNAAMRPPMLERQCFASEI